MSSKLITIILISLAVGLSPVYFLGTVYAANFEIGDNVEVYGAGNLGLKIYRNHCSDRFPPDKNRFDGERGALLEGPIDDCDGYNRWKIKWEKDNLVGWSAEDWLKKVHGTTPPEDNQPPTVDAFVVFSASEAGSTSITLGDRFVISYTVSDIGGSELKQVELWRSSISGIEGWEKIQTTPISGNTKIGYFYNSPSSVGTYWYGIHVVDSAENWNDEQNSHTGGVPGDFGPIEVEVTSLPTDTTSPVISSVSPANGAIDISRTLERVKIVFSEPMDRSTYSGNYIFLADSQGHQIGGSAYQGESEYHVVISSQILKPNSVYFVHVTTDVTDVAGNHLAEELVSSFTTEGEIPLTDTIPPTILSVSPANGAIDISRTLERVKIVFSEPMDRSTYSGNYIFLADSQGHQIGGSAYQGESEYHVVISSQILKPNSVYFVHVTTDVTDVAGNHLAEELVSSFTTEGEIPPASTCSDGIKNQDETDVDCGGSCSVCENGEICNVDSDCQSGLCQGGICVWNIPEAINISGQVKLENESGFENIRVQLVELLKSGGAGYPVGETISSILTNSSGEYQFRDIPVPQENAGYIILAGKERFAEDNRSIYRNSNGLYIFVNGEKEYVDGEAIGLPDMILSKPKQLSFHWSYQPNGTLEFTGTGLTYGTAILISPYRAEQPANLIIGGKGSDECGFLFESQNVTGSIADFGFSNSYQYPTTFWANNGSGGIHDMGNVSLDSVSSCSDKSEGVGSDRPESYYINQATDAVVGHTYCVLTKDGLHYAKFRVTGIENYVEGEIPPVDKYYVNAHSVYFPSGDYSVELMTNDTNQSIQSVSVTGPGIDGSISLEQGIHSLHPNQWWSKPNVDFSSDPPDLPLVYTFTITDKAGATYEIKDSVQSYVDSFATNLLPEGNQTNNSDFVFSWTGVGIEAVKYKVELYDEDWSRKWDSPLITDTSFTYNGSALGFGDYQYFVAVFDENGNSSLAYQTFQIGNPPENQPPDCTIELQNNDGQKINEINVGESFNIYVGDSTGDISQVRFLSDESQNGEADENCGWTDPPFSWNESGDTSWGWHWDHSNKKMEWSFDSPGEKEIWVEIKNNNGTSTRSADISTNSILPVPYYSQGNTDWCVPTSMAMILKYYGRNIHSWDIAKEWGWNRDHLELLPLGGKINTYFNASELGLSSKNIEVNFDAIHTAIDNKSPVLLSLKSPVQGIKHAVVVVGYSNANNLKQVYISDPSGALLCNKLNLCQKLIAVPVPWDCITKFICKMPLSYAIAVEGKTPLRSNLPKGTLNIDSDAGFQFEGSNSKVYSWFNKGLEWKSDRLYYGNDTFRYWKEIANHTKNQQTYSLEIEFFEKNGYSPLPHRVPLNKVNFNSRSSLPSGMDPISLQSLLGENYGEYTITLTLYNSDFTEEYDKIVFPSIEYTGKLCAFNPSYGYNFANKGVKKDTMSESAKWKIFKEAFDWKDIDSVTQEKLFDTWVNNGKNWWEGNCFGMSVSSLMEYVYPKYDNFLEHKKEKTLYDFDEPSVSGIGGSLIPTNPWNGINAIDTVLEHILKFQIMTNSQIVQEKLSISDDKIEEYNPINVVMKLKSCPEKYVLGIANSKTDYSHAVVPYKVEEQDDGYKIYIYDPDSPDYDDEWPNKTWIEAREGKWELFKEIAPFPIYKSKKDGDFLIPWSIEKIYNNKDLLKPAVPLAEGDYPLYHFCGSGNFYFVDSQGRITGIKDGELINEIPQVHREYNFVDSNGEESEDQPQTYYVSDDIELTVVIKGTGKGTYSLTKFGPGYFADISDVSISNGVTDSIDFSSDSAKLSFSENQEPKTYNFTLNKNIDGTSQTFTATDIPTAGGQIHQYTIDWDVLSQGGEGTTLKIDLDGDGNFEETIITGATFQPPAAPAVPAADDEPNQTAYTAPSGGGGGGSLPPALSISGSSIRTSAIGENTATINWRTSQFSTSRVIYSSEDETHNFDSNNSPNYGYAHSTKETSTKATGHHITLYDLYPGTTYYYRCISASSPDVISPEHSFTTSGEKMVILLGDINRDGKVDILDFNLLIVNWGDNPENQNADFNSDGKLDILDFNILMVNYTKI